MDVARDDAEEGGGSGAAEYVAGALGGLLVLALVGFLAYQALGARETGPELAVVVTGVEETGADWTVYFQAVNSGGHTAEGVQIEGAVLRAGRPVDRASSSIAYLPAHSSRAGALVFSTDPASGELEVGPVGYRLP
ncbi:hypothetical protein ACI784_23320 [Geodermatophilus sp. SYSU D01186]